MVCNASCAFTTLTLKVKIVQRHFGGPSVRAEQDAAEVFPAKALRKRVAAERAQVGDRGAGSPLASSGCDLAICFNALFEAAAFGFKIDSAEFSGDFVRNRVQFSNAFNKCPQYRGGFVLVIHHRSIPLNTVLRDALSNIGYKCADEPM